MYVYMLFLKNQIELVIALQAGNNLMERLLGYLSGKSQAIQARTSLVTSGVRRPQSLDYSSYRLVTAYHVFYNLKLCNM